ncbi:aminoglycoside phosphotransferase family protein [Amycolatopsis roodepoortensis]|uniref:phosphotransferase enzyme family protein n=1 Tax=Amycolatopsis roodepoortensis TaxID=700274 RepID=UPI00214CD75C|nr:aminoglycoside phosphotransferase family protein [Amycolatopsis roodepoortensis]UUV32289.1 aminoglycoside phosphotransferase family protein [Amycolatopsis roodepoortensis]
MSTASLQLATKSVGATSTPGRAADVEQIMAIADTLVLGYGLDPAEISRIPEGTATDNYSVVDQSGHRLFVKVYRARDKLDLERASIELSEYAADGGVATARVIRSSEHELIETRGRLPLSLWSYVPHTETAEGTLSGARWSAVGAEMGRLHRRLATHPAAAPTLKPGATLCDVAAARDRFDTLISAYEHKVGLGKFETWALQAVRERQAVLGDVERILAALPPLTVQVMHGDLAGPNVLLKNDDVAAIVDFGPPTPGYLAWEIVRLGCDPKSVLSNGTENWLTGYTDLALAYRDANPKAPADDLLSSLRVGCAAKLCATFPLSAPVERPHLVDAALESYARARHEAALMLLDRLPALDETLRSTIR